MEHDATYRRAAREAVARALEEDRAGEDVTTAAVAGSAGRAMGRVLFRREGIVAGSLPFMEAFHALDRDVEVIWSVAEGERVEAGAEVCRVRGAVASLLRAERTALNFLMRLSGIATLTARFVGAAAGHGVEILDTRKTTPGLRILEKGAVRAGGGTNHRPDLASLALIKENHIAVAGGIARAVEAVRAASPGVPIEVEVRALGQLAEVEPLGVERVMLDNFPLPAIGEAAGRIAAWKRRPYIELSGGIDLEKARAAAPLGIDGISIGALTHSAPAADLSFLLEGVGS